MARGEAQTQLVRRRCLISGQVQMVGFRAFAVLCAVDLQLEGWIRNTEDGSVEALVQGSAEAVELFLTRLRPGPAPAEVSGFVVSQEEAGGRLGRFRPVS